MTLSDKEISPSWRSNQLLTGDKVSTNFSPLSWSNGGARAGFTKWEAQNVELLEPAEEIDIVTEASELLEEGLDITKLIVVADAAPTIPNLGISITFNITLINKEISKMEFNIFCLPVIFK